MYRFRIYTFLSQFAYVPADDCGRSRNEFCIENILESEIGSPDVRYLCYLFGVSLCCRIKQPTGLCVDKQQLSGAD
jgi:hypothetical protein